MTKWRLWLLLGVVTNCFADGVAPIPVGDDAYLMWDHWAYQRIGMRAYMRSTYDRSGGNQWSDASHFLYQLADDYNVTLDVAGAGVLYFVRTNHWHGSPWHYDVDGHDYIVRESSTADPLHPVVDSVFLPQSAFPSPLALTWSRTKGADLSWVPIGFQKSFRMAYGRTFYGSGYYIFDQFVEGTPLSRPIVPWNPNRTPDLRVPALLERAGSDIAPPSGIAGVQEVHGSTQLAPGAETTIWRLVSAPSMVRVLELSVPRAEALRFSHARLRITWDDRPMPSIDTPVALFYGAGLLYNRDEREYLVKSLPMVIRYDAARVHLSCYFPMPFFRSARITLTNDGDEPFEGVEWSVRYAPFDDPPTSVGYFHASYRDIPAPVAGQDLTLLDTRLTEGGGDWSGSLVGTSFIFSHDARLDALEGDPRFFFDDSLTPQAQGTGTEEWGGGGDFWGGENMTLAFAGHPIGAANRRKARDPADAVESAYRFLLSDLMPFGRNAEIRLEHGGRDEVSEHYQTVTYWYGLPAASLVKTDELAVGDPISEVQHRYVSPDASDPYLITSRYEWGPDNLHGVEIYPASTDRGRTTRTGSEFTLRIDPRNLGVLLRRKLDYSYPNQCAEIYVSGTEQKNPDWQLAGIWYTAGSNTTVGSYGGIGRQLTELESEDTSRPSPLLRYANSLYMALLRLLPGDDHHSAETGPAEHLVSTSNRRFRDDEFLIPRRLTQHRSAIRMRVRFTPMATPLYPGQPLPQLAWSEMRYTAYSFVTPAFALK